MPSPAAANPAGSNTGTGPALLITDAEIIDSAGRRKGDIFIDGETIAEVGAGATAAAESTRRQPSQISAAGQLVLPALVDLFTSIHQPDLPLDQALAAASAAATCGGYTAIQILPDTEPPIDSLTNLAELRRTASAPSCDIVPSASISVNRAGTRLVPIAELAAAGVGWFTDVGIPPSEQFLFNAMKNLAAIGATLAVSPRTPALAAGTVMAEGAVSSRLGLRGEPAASEEIATEMLLALAAHTGCSVHLDRLSSAAAVERLRRYKQSDQPKTSQPGTAQAGAPQVSASVSAQHLFFTEDDCAQFNPALRAEPHYRSAQDRAALRQGVEDGVIDAIVSAHSPHRSEDTDVPFELAPPGSATLGLAASVALGSCELSPQAAAAALSWQPAALAGIADRHGCDIVAGAPANLTLFDPNETWEVSTDADRTGDVRADAFINTRNSPYLGRTLTGRVTNTIFEGQRLL